ncbi:uncharacterized protein LOC135952505 [Calliphora vicina]|uniref:uncharacterized protein LOC135952505 n=1 Tax=Calliphora vicina TaxID=7373 RepID=UPI00325B418E
MKIFTFFFIAASVFICLQSVKAFDLFSTKSNVKEGDDDSVLKSNDPLNRNSIYRNGEAIYARSHQDHKVHNNLQEDTSSAVVKDKNGNVQESSQTYITNRNIGL